jgi:hypothetical protein
MNPIESGSPSEPGLSEEDPLQPATLAARANKRAKLMTRLRFMGILVVE